MLNRLIEKGSKKCHNYWPSSPGDILDCAEAGLVVINESVVPGQHYNLTTLSISNTEVMFHNWYSGMIMNSWGLGDASGSISTVISCACFGLRHSPYSNFLCRTLDIAAVGNIFNVFSYDTMSSRDSNLTLSRQRADALRVTPLSRVFSLLRDDNPGLYLN